MAKEKPVKKPSATEQISVRMPREIYTLITAKVAEEGYKNRSELVVHYLERGLAGIFDLSPQRAPLLFSDSVECMLRSGVSPDKIRKVLEDRVTGYNTLVNMSNDAKLKEEEKKF